MSPYLIAVIFVYVLFGFGTWWQYRTYTRAVSRLEQMHAEDLAAERMAVYEEANALIEREIILNESKAMDLAAENMRLRGQVEQLQSYARERVVLQAREYVSEQMLAHMVLDPAALEREIHYRITHELAGTIIAKAVVKTWSEPAYMRRVVEMRVPLETFIPDEAMEPVPSPKWRPMPWMPRLIPRVNPEIDEILKSANATTEESQ